MPRRCQVLAGVAGPDLAPVFIKGHVQDQWRLFSLPQWSRVACSRDSAPATAAGGPP